MSSINQASFHHSRFKGIRLEFLYRCPESSLQYTRLDKHKNERGYYHYAVNDFLYLLDIKAV